MRLKSLEIQGFKSFATKSVFDFDEGITAIVGPNGSGKSNIADAIRWVLGEQSYTSMRAQKTSDMIYSGSTNKARMGMAYVSIVLDNSDGSLPLDYNEVTIARRAFRSGENEYLINNNRVRLKDIAEVLAKGGLARQTYTLVGQGTIDRALSLRANERRQLFEEAAGITYHRQRRAETLRRLTETRQNLLRVHDIVKEIEPRLKRMSRQAERVAEHGKIRHHLDGLLKVWYGFQWGQGQQDIHHARVRNTIGQERLNEAQENLNQIDQKIQQLRSEQTELRGQLGDWHAKSSRLHSQAEAIQRELAVGEERARHLAAQREEFISEVEILEQDLASHQNQVKEAQEAQAAIEQSYQETRQSLQAAEQKLARYETERATLIHQQEQAEKQAQAATRNLADRESRLNQLAEQIQMLETQQQENGTAMASLQTQKAEAEQTLTTMQDKVAQLIEDLAALNKQQAAKTEELQQLRETINGQRQTLAAEEKALATSQARQDLLSKLRQDLSGYHGGVKEVLQTKSLSGIKGTIAQLVQVPVHLEAAFEAAIGGRLQEIVVDHWADADAAIKYLKQNQSGRATFLPLDSLRPPPALSSPKIAGLIGLATDLVSFDKAVTPAAESLLNRLLIADDLATAQAAFKQLQGSFQIATLSGEIVRSGGSVTGGRVQKKHQGGSFLAREREARELPKQISAIEQKIRTIETAIKASLTKQADYEASIAQLDTQKNMLAQSINAADGELNQQTSTLATFANQISWHTQSQKRLEKEIEENRSQQATFRANMERLTEEQAQGQQRAADLETEIAALSAENLTVTLNQVQTQITIIQEKRQNQQALLKNFTTNFNQVQSQIDQRQARINSLAQQRQSLLDQLESQRGEHLDLVEAVKAFTEQIDPAEATLNSLESEQENAEQEEGTLRNQVRRLEAEANRFSLELARQQDKMNDLQRQIEDDFGLVQFQYSDDQIAQTILPIQSMVTQLPTINELPEGIEEDIRHFKLQMRRLGNINPDAPREYEDLKERFDFLTSQMTDLEAATKDLKAIIDELDKIMESAFSDTYVKVAKAFQGYFKILFNGGEAQLILTDPDDITETGIEIVARPPGKRPQSLELLSGGERSLTAQALIFALLKTSPTPYCIFDEVDAMLDEANVDRFRKALLALGKDIQFIVITHNRKTIEISNTVYGIFMREDAVSEAVSLKLDDFSEQDTEQISFQFNSA